LNNCKSCILCGKYRQGLGHKRVLIFCPESFANHKRRNRIRNQQTVFDCLNDPQGHQARRPGKIYLRLTFPIYYLFVRVSELWEGKQKSIAAGICALFFDLRATGKTAALFLCCYQFPVDFFHLLHFLAHLRDLRAPRRPGDPARIRPRIRATCKRPPLIIELQIR